MSQERFSREQLKERVVKYCRDIKKGLRNAVKGVQFQNSNSNEWFEVVLRGDSVTVHFRFQGHPSHAAYLSTTPTYTHVSCVVGGYGIKRTFINEKKCDLDIQRVVDTVVQKLSLVGEQKAEDRSHEKREKTNKKRAKSILKTFKRDLKNVDVDHDHEGVHITVRNVSDNCAFAILRAAAKEPNADQTP